MSPITRASARRASSRDTAATATEEIGRLKVVESAVADGGKKQTNLTALPVAGPAVQSRVPAMRAPHPIVLFKATPAPPVEYSPLRPRQADVLLSADSDYDSPTTQHNKRLRREKRAQAYLKGHALYILSARIRGPLDLNWTNPWATKRTADEMAPTAPPKKHRKKREKVIDLTGDSDIELLSPIKKRHERAKSVPSASPARIKKEKLKSSSKATHITVSSDESDIEELLDTPSRRPQKRRAVDLRSRTSSVAPRTVSGTSLAYKRASTVAPSAAKKKAIDDGHPIAVKKLTQFGKFLIDHAETQPDPDSPKNKRSTQKEQRPEIKMQQPPPQPPPKQPLPPRRISSPFVTAAVTKSNEVPDSDVEVPNVLGIKAKELKHQLNRMKRELMDMDIATDANAETLLGQMKDATSHLRQILQMFLDEEALRQMATPKKRSAPEVETSTRETTVAKKRKTTREPSARPEEPVPVPVLPILAQNEAASSKLAANTVLPKPVTTTREQIPPDSETPVQSKSAMKRHRRREWEQLAASQETISVTTAQKPSQEEDEPIEVPQKLRKADTPAMRSMSLEKSSKTITATPGPGYVKKQHLPKAAEPQTKVPTVVRKTPTPSVQVTSSLKPPVSILKKQPAKKEMKQVSNTRSLSEKEVVRNSFPSIPAPSKQLTEKTKEAAANDSTSSSDITSSISSSDSSDDENSSEYVPSVQRKNISSSQPASQRRSQVADPVEFSPPGPSFSTSISDHSQQRASQINGGSSKSSQRGKSMPPTSQQQQWQAPKKTSKAEWRRDLKASIDRGKEEAAAKAAALVHSKKSAKGSKDEQKSMSKSSDPKGRRSRSISVPPTPASKSRTKSDEALRTKEPLGHSKHEHTIPDHGPMHKDRVARLAGEEVKGSPHVLPPTSQHLEFAYERKGKSKESLPNPKDADLEDDMPASASKLCRKCKRHGRSVCACGIQIQAPTLSQEVRHDASQASVLDVEEIEPISSQSKKKKKRSSTNASQRSAADPDDDEPESSQSKKEKRRRSSAGASQISIPDLDGVDDDEPVSSQSNKEKRRSAVDAKSSPTKGKEIASEGQMASSTPGRSKSKTSSRSNHSTGDAVMQQDAQVVSKQQPSIISINQLETEKFPSTREAESSTQSQFIQAQRSLQRDLATPIEPSGSEPTSKNKSSSHKKKKHLARNGEKISTPKSSQKVVKGGEEPVFSTQQLIENMSPFHESTAKKKPTSPNNNGLFNSVRKPVGALLGLVFGAEETTPVKQKGGASQKGSIKLANDSDDSEYGLQMPYSLSQLQEDSFESGLMGSCYATAQDPTNVSDSGSSDSFAGSMFDHDLMSNNNPLDPSGNSFDEELTEDESTTHPASRSSGKVLTIPPVSSTGTRMSQLQDAQIPNGLATAQRSSNSLLTEQRMTGWSTQG